MESGLHGAGHNSTLPGMIHESIPTFTMQAYCDCGVLIYILDLLDKGRII